MFRIAVTLLAVAVSLQAAVPCAHGCHADRGSAHEGSGHACHDRTDATVVVSPASTGCAHDLGAADAVLGSGSIGRDESRGSLSPHGLVTADALSSFTSFGLGVQRPPIPCSLSSPPVRFSAPLRI